EIDDLSEEKYPEQPLLKSVNRGACEIGSPSFDSCILGKFREILPKLTNGVPEYNMPVADPYFYRKGIFRYANDGIQGGVLVRNMNIRGIANSRINSIRTNFQDTNNFEVNVDGFLPRLIADGGFKADVKFGGLRLVPKGIFNVTVLNVKAQIRTTGSLVQTPQGQRVQLKTLDADIDVGNAKVSANGIFSDRNLSKYYDLEFDHENMPEITRTGIPATKSQWAPIVIQHINGFFANVPIEQLLTQA
uniref:Hemolymph juvenile hormone binding protein n=1 Tax=Megaselia scalaris TaxID=36166 RepID=T1GLG1_MEGSC